MTGKAYEERMDRGGKISLVTGGAGGIGRSICEKLATLGSFVYVCDIRGASEVADHINAGYQVAGASGVPCDISDRETVEATYARIARERDGVDILQQRSRVWAPGVPSFPRTVLRGFREDYSSRPIGRCVLHVVGAAPHEGRGR